MLFFGLRKDQDTVKVGNNVSFYIVLMLPTEAAASSNNSIDGNTYHIALGMPIGSKLKHAPSRQIQRLPMSQENNR
jgi:hypothetical protein